MTLPLAVAVIAIGLVLVSAVFIVAAASYETLSKFKHWRRQELDAHAIAEAAKRRAAEMFGVRS